MALLGLILSILALIISLSPFIIRTIYFIVERFKNDNPFDESFNKRQEDFLNTYIQYIHSLHNLSLHHYFFIDED